jgi:HK97 gp10 family phage protein
MPEEFLNKISSLADKTDEIVPRVLDAGGKVVLAKAKSNLQSAIGKGTKYESRSTGELVSALGVSGARLDRDGNYNVKIGMREPRAGGGSNAKIANIIEHGKHGQPAKPFMKPAMTASKKTAIQAMVEELEKEIRRV